MKFFNNITDELWLGIMFMVVAMWVFLLNSGYYLISIALLFVGLFFIVFDHINSTKNEKIEAEVAETKKDSKKVSKKEIAKK